MAENSHDDPVSRIRDGRADFFLCVSNGNSSVRGRHSRRDRRAILPLIQGSRGAGAVTILGIGLDIIGVKKAILIIFFYLYAVL